MREVFFKPGEIIFEKGDPAEVFYVIAEGSVEVFDPETSFRVATITHGGTFGEQSALGYGARNLSARALEDSHCIEHSGEELRSLLATESTQVTHALEMLLLQLEMVNALHVKGSKIQF